MATLKIDQLYKYLTNEEDARTCRDIPDDACKYVPKNFFLIIISNTFTKLGDALSNPKTVLTWLMNYVHAPIYLISFLVPIRESGSMLPQILIASYVRKLSVRKWVWVIGSVLQFTTIFAIGLIALRFKGSFAGWLIILMLILYSLSRGLASISSKDVIGKTIPKRRRGRLNGFSTSISGALALLTGLFITYRSNENLGIEFYSYLIFFASGLWLLGALVYSNIEESSGETSGGSNAFKEAIDRLAILKKDKPFRDFVISRALLLCSALTAPYYVILAQENSGTEAYLLGLFIIANGVATSLSAPFWGKMADKSSKYVMGFGALITSSLGFIMFILISFSTSIR